MANVRPARTCEYIPASLTRLASHEPLMLGSEHIFITALAACSASANSKPALVRLSTDAALKICVLTNLGALVSSPARCLLVVLPRSNIVRSHAMLVFCPSQVPHHASHAPFAEAILDTAS